VLAGAYSRAVQRARARRRERDPDEERPEEFEHDHPVLALQGAVGNHAVARMLQPQRAVARKEQPPTTRMGETPVTQLYGKTDERTWASMVRAQKYVPLFAELAQMIQASKVEDVKGTDEANINPVMRWDGNDLKQGLNFAANLPGRRRTGFLVDGKFTMKLPAEKPEGALPSVVVMLGPKAFDADNKALALGVLRHELEHAVHSRMAINWLKQWRAKDRGQTRFLRWLGRQQIASVELKLIEENLGGGSAGTEALANAEGFMAALRVERENVHPADGPASDELRDVAEFWGKVDDAAVKGEVVARLKAYAASLSQPLLKKYQQTLRELKAKKGVYAKFVTELEKK
jgi:hypothetical protein